MRMDSVGANAVAADGDFSVVKGWLRALEMTKPIAEHPARILPDMIDDLARTLGDAPALLSDRESLTFRALSERSNRYARWALAAGLGKGDGVCLLMPNRPEYMAIWLGINRVGGVVALLNTNLVGPSLAHCIDIVGPKHIIVAGELTAAFASARPHLTINAKVWSHGDGSEFPNIEYDVDGRSGAPLNDSERRPLTIADRALYIYTSGTTGLPKAANVNHQRLLTWSCWFAGMMDTRPGDRMYNCLPMYHSIGGVVATGAVLVNGGSVVIRDRFSASEFWDDILRFDCTLFQYIGELCRYLVHTKPHPREREHRLRMCCGNGLRPDVWSEFKERFRIPRILEFYAATEGNVTMFNYEGKPGAIGRIPSFLAHRSPTALVKFDVETGALVRNERGFCIRCRPNEVGEAIGKIFDAGLSLGVGLGAGLGGRFEGYTSKAESEKKVLRDVFEPGDAWFRTGDLMRKDKSGYFYFIDRIGDTFRWKGENVSTSEVSEAITAFPGITAATVYGVAVPGTEGRSGMAAIVSDTALDLAAFREHLVTRLPDYARPLFLRVQNEIEITSTFKHKKSDLVRDGYDPTVTMDPIYFNDSRRNAFVALDRALHDRIESGEMRL
jgi:fatty-acyl-CoA synthase